MAIDIKLESEIILFKSVECAEIEGMDPEDCGVVFEAVANCFDAIGSEQHRVSNG